MQVVKVWLSSQKMKKSKGAQPIISITTVFLDMYVQVYLVILDYNFFTL